jgi:hypothetical protein
MKTGILLILCLISICFNVYGQNEEIAANEKLRVATGRDPITHQEITNADKFTTPVYDQAHFLQKSKTQKSNGLVLLTGGSVISFFGISSRLDISNGDSFINSPFHSNRDQYTTYSGLALTGLVMMAGSIAYFINSWKNKNKAGLKFTCQKTSFGAPNKALKKVSGLTFSIPIGDRLAFRYAHIQKFSYLIYQGKMAR